MNDNLYELTKSLAQGLGAVAILVVAILVLMLLFLGGWSLGNEIVDRVL